MSSMMGRRLSFLLIAISCVSTLCAQDWIFIQKQDVAQRITASDVGSLGQLFVGTIRGNVYSFYPDGNPDKHFSSSVFKTVSDLDASNALRIFVFYKETNQFEFLERFAAQPRLYNLDDYGIAQADHVSLDKDGTLWLLSGQDLFHVNVLNNSVLSEQRLPLNYHPENLTNMVYNHSVFLSDLQRGIFQMDASNQSSFLIQETGINDFDFFGKELVTLTDRGIVISVNGEIKRIRPPREGFEKVLKSKEAFYFIKGSEIYFYRFQE